MFLEYYSVTILCDKCRILFELPNGNCEFDNKDVNEILWRNNWKTTTDEKHYCPKCKELIKK